MCLVEVHGHIPGLKASDGEVMCHDESSGPRSSSIALACASLLCVLIVVRSSNVLTFFWQVGLHH